VIEALSNMQNSLRQEIKTPQDFMKMSRSGFVAPDLLCRDHVLEG